MEKDRSVIVGWIVPPKKYHDTQQNLTLTDIFSGGRILNFSWQWSDPPPSPKNSSLATSIGIGLPAVGFLNLFGCLDVLSYC